MKCLGDLGLSKLITLIKNLFDTLVDSEGHVLAPSPIYTDTGSTHTLNIEDCGKTLLQNSTLDNSSMTYSLTQENSTLIPDSGEIAILWLFGSSISISTTGIRLAISGESNILSDNTVNISDRYGMVAMKKLYTDNTNGDLWLVTGNVEVVT